MKTSFWQRWRTWGPTTPRIRPGATGPRLQAQQLEDRTLPSAQLLADINPGSASSNPSQVVVIGSEAYFAANDGTHGNELWKTDGTASGTTPVADINAANLTSVNGELFFSVDNGGNYQLWKSDGTTAGTTLVKDMLPLPSYFTNVSGTLFFAGNFELWKSDGTAAGTVQLTHDTNVPEDLTNGNGELFFFGLGNRHAPHRCVVEERWHCRRHHHGRRYWHARAVWLALLPRPPHECQRRVVLPG